MAKTKCRKCWTNVEETALICHKCRVFSPATINPSRDVIRRYHKVLAKQICPFCEAPALNDKRRTCASCKKPVPLWDEERKRTGVGGSLLLGLVPVLVILLLVALFVSMPHWNLRTAETVANIVGIPVGIFVVVYFVMATIGLDSNVGKK